MADSYLEVPGAPRRRRRRRRVHPFTLTLMGIGVLALIGWYWYAVFSPIYEDPHAYAVSERSFRRALKEVLTGQRTDGEASIPDLPPWPPPLTEAQSLIVACADEQVARGVEITKGYMPLKYPWGDIPAHLGTSPDIVVRCMRRTGLDLQQLLYVDRVAHPRRYPLEIWGHPRADRSIDHRRMPMLAAFARIWLEKHPVLVDTPAKLAAFLPGDLVFWGSRKAGGHPALAGWVTDRRGSDGVPRVVTLAPADRRVTDSHGLTDWTITGHYRVNPDALLGGFLDAHPNTKLMPRPKRTESERP